MASPNIKFEVLPTPNPEEVSIRVWNDANQMSPNSIPTIGQSYKASPIKGNKPRVEEFGDYVYTYMSKEGDDIWFYFGKNRTTAQRNTPFRTWSDTRQYTWPAVLEDLYFVQSSIPQYINTGTGVDTAPRLLARYRYRPATPYNSIIVVSQYLSEVPFAQAVMTHDFPVPTDVNGSYLGIQVDFPRCLHDTVTFPEKVPGAQIVQGVGMVNPPFVRNPAKMTFPATNFLDWTDFVIEDKQTPVNGLFLREQVRIYPPNYQPDSIFT